MPYSWKTTTPEYGKEKFRTRFTRELDRVKSLYSDVPYVGLGDGAKDNWTFLTQHTDEQVLDFWHASEYVSDDASVLFKGASRRKPHFHLIFPNKTTLYVLYSCKSVG